MTYHEVGQASVPSPLVMHVHPYPTRFHGGIWRRPAFGFPWVRSPMNVLRPSQMSGLGTWNVGDGVFRRPMLDGGGIFNEISGLGALDATTAAFVGGGALAFGLVAFLLTRQKPAPMAQNPARRRKRRRRR